MLTRSKAAAARQKCLQEKMIETKISTPQKKDSKHETGPFRLLELSAEIRVTILRHALVYSKRLLGIPQYVATHSPISFIQNNKTKDGNMSNSGARRDVFSLLATCKQVREEGLSIFWGENTFEISIHPEFAPTCRFLQVPIGFHHKGFPHIAGLIKKLKVVVYDSHCSWDYHVYDYYDYFGYDYDCDFIGLRREGVNVACEAIDTHFDPSKVSLEVKLSQKPSPFDTNKITKLCEDICRCHEFLSPLAYLRRIHSAKVYGVQPQHATYLEQQTMKEECIENIWKMRKAFLEWFDHWQGRGFMHEEDLYPIDDAWHNCDIPQFKQLRDEQIRERREEIEKSFRDVF